MAITGICNTQNHTTHLQALPIWICRFEIGNQSESVGFRLGTHVTLASKEIYKQTVKCHLPGPALGQHPIALPTWPGWTWCACSSGTKVQVNSSKEAYTRSGSWPCLSNTNSIQTFTYHPGYHIWCPPYTCSTNTSCHLSSHTIQGLLTPWIHE